MKSRTLIRSNWYLRFILKALHCLTLQYGKQVDFQSNQADSYWNFHRPVAVNTKLVSTYDSSPRRLSVKNTNNVENPSPSNREKQSLSTLPENSDVGSSFIKEGIGTCHLLEVIRNICDSWRDNIKFRCESILRK